MSRRCFGEQRLVGAGLDEENAPLAERRAVHRLGRGGEGGDRSPNIGHGVVAQNLGRSHVIHVATGHQHRVIGERQRSGTHPRARKRGEVRPAVAGHGVPGHCGGRGSLGRPVFASEHDDVSGRELDRRSESPGYGGRCEARPAAPRWGSLAGRLGRVAGRCRTGHRTLACRGLGGRVCRCARARRIRIRFGSSLLGGWCARDHRHRRECSSTAHPETAPYQHHTSVSWEMGCRRAPQAPTKRRPTDAAFVPSSLSGRAGRGTRCPGRWLLRSRCRGV